jgi:hypothetical protein
VSGELRKYLDANNVTLFVNPEHILQAVVNREGLGRPWAATFTLTDGSQFVLWDDSAVRLCQRIVAGDE